MKMKVKRTTEQNLKLPSRVGRHAVNSFSCSIFVKSNRMFSSRYYFVGT